MSSTLTPAATLELGLDTFGDVTVDADGRRLSQVQVIRDVIAELAIASGTTRMRLMSTVTVLSSDDPTRVFQRFSTIDAASNGRAEVILGVARSPSRSPCPGSGWTTTRRCSRKSSTCSRRCWPTTERTLQCRGGERRARRSWRSGCFRRRNRARCVRAPPDADALHRTLWEARVSTGSGAAGCHFRSVMRLPHTYFVVPAMVT